jgi:hypothetical protein
MYSFPNDVKSDPSIVQSYETFFSLWHTFISNHNSLTFKCSHTIAVQAKQQTQLEAKLTYVCCIFELPKKKKMPAWSIART